MHELTQDYLIKINKKLYSLRLTQKEIAQTFNLGKTNLNMMLNGRRKFDIEYAVAIEIVTNGEITAKSIIIEQALNAYNMRYEDVKLSLSLYAKDQIEKLEKQISYYKNL